jgi:competence protein ComEC
MSLSRIWLPALFLAAVLCAAKPLTIYVIDVEGGKSMLVLTPAGEVMLVDAGWSGAYNDKFVVDTPNERDSGRILEVLKLEKVRKIDYFVVTHYDADHVGNVARLAARLAIPVRNFVDHGELQNQNPVAVEDVRAYRQAIEKLKANRILARPGALIPIRGVEVRIVASGGEVIPDALEGAGQPNPFCPEPPSRPDRGENPASVALLYTLGAFRMADFADLTKGREYELMCPVNRAGPVDLWMVSHHGMDMSNGRWLVHALAPQVAILNNGAKKGGKPEPLGVIRSSPGLADLWQLHYSLEAKELNAPEQFIANPQTGQNPASFGEMLGDGARWIKVVASEDGEFTVTNSRNNFSRTYRSRRAARAAARDVR